MNPKFEELRKNWMDFEEFKERFQKVTVEEYPNNVLQAVPKPEVTVKITTYQHVEFISEALESVLNQETEYSYEIVIGDDESTDGTREICIDYAKKYPDKIRLFLHKRDNNIKLFGKPTHLFQYYYNGFHCRGKYITGCSGDDYWTDENKIQKQTEYLEDNPEYSLVYHSWQKEITSTNEQIFVKADNIPRIQTILAKNVSDIIPTIATEVLQEDSLHRIVWSQYGKFKYLADIKPSVRREHGNNMFKSESNKLRRKHKKNFSIKTLLYFKDILNKSKQKKMAQKYLHVLSLEIKNENYGNRLFLILKSMFNVYVYISMYYYFKK